MSCNTIGTKFCESHEDGHFERGVYPQNSGLSVMDGTYSDTLHSVLSFRHAIFMSVDCQ
jgi:hypothetical protein